MMSGNTSNGTILEDDQQLYDWGIENRLDQYYQVKMIDRSLTILLSK